MALVYQNGYAVSRLLDILHVLQVFVFLIFRRRFNQLSGVWHTVGPRDLAECRGADTVWQQQRYKLSHTSVRQFGIKCSVHR